MHQLNVTRQVIGELNVKDIPYLVAYNKIDKISQDDLETRG
jgi:50S ribosomal subunit-associated GTPase HflX